MTSPLLPPFLARLEQAEDFARLWHPLEERIHQHLRAVYESRPDDHLFRSRLQRLEEEREGMKNSLQDAFERLLDSLHHPELVLAATGTTSSGKSALVNLLCGAEIMPVAFDEMSAGVVTIHHGPSRALTIHETPRAVWDCGTWTGLTDDAIYNRLLQVMRAYHQRSQEACRHPEDGLPPACPKCDLEYPTRIGEQPELLDLPGCCRFRILDLPGLKYVGDEANSQAIRASREALCLVTYNSEETDPVKQERLLEQVVDQVKELGGSPARMLFVLNRIDSLRRDDKEWPGNEEAFVDRMTRDIRETLKKRLPEQADALNRIRVVRLSTEPALLSLHLSNDAHPNQNRAAGKLNGTYNTLIPEEIKDDLPRRIEKWEKHVRQRVAEAVWHTAHADAFFSELRNHIHAHFPDLVIPQAVDRFKVEAGARVAEWAVQTASAELNGSHERYEEERARIAAARDGLQDLCEATRRQLLEPFDRIREKLGDAAVDTRSLFDAVHDTLNRLLEYPQFQRLPPQALEPLRHWQVEMARKRSRTIEAVACILQGRDEPPEDVIDGLPPRHLHAWHMAIRKLSEAGYTAETARRGEHVDTYHQEEKQRLRALNAAINDLTDILSPLLEHAMGHAAAREQRRVFDVIRQLLEVHWGDVTERAQVIVREAGLSLDLTVPPVDLDLEEQALTLAYSFPPPEFSITSGSRQEPTQKRKQVEVGRERRWYTAWLIEHPVYKEEPVFVYRDYETADIPKAEDLLEQWDRHAREQQPALVRQFIEWMDRQVNRATASLEQSHRELLDRYEAKLDEAHAVAERTHADTRQAWLPILERARNLQECLGRLCRVPAREAK